MRLSENKGVIAPEGGWKERTYYAVDVSYSSGNPIHRSVFYTGFLNNGVPCGYNQIWNPTSEETHTLWEVYYLKVARELDVDG